MKRIWESLEWMDFEKALVAYRDKYFETRSEEQYYCDIFTQLQTGSVRQRAQHSESIVKFLNQWHCRFSKDVAPVVLETWFNQEAQALENISLLSLEMVDVPRFEEEFSRLHDSLIALKRGGYRRGIHNIGDAAASKILHLMIPPLFVMWDIKIKPKGSSYGAFMCEMHDFSLFLSTVIAPSEARGDLVGYLQDRLGYPVRKPLAKYIDEYNWYLAWQKL